MAQTEDAGSICLSIGGEQLEEHESIRKQAQGDLTIRLDDNREDIVLWEHTVRVVRLVEQISMLPEVQARRVNRLALKAAAYYHDAGWAIQFSEGTLNRWEIRSRPTSEVQRKLAADWMGQRLAGLLPDAYLRMATLAVRQCKHR